MFQTFKQRVFIFVNLTTDMDNINMLGTSSLYNYQVSRGGNQ